MSKLCKKNLVQAPISICILTTYSTYVVYLNNYIFMHLCKYILISTLCNYDSQSHTLLTAIDKPLLHVCV